MLGAFWWSATPVVAVLPTTFSRDAAKFLSASSRCFALSFLSVGGRKRDARRAGRAESLGNNNTEARVASVTVCP